MLKMDYSLLRGTIRTYFGSETNFVKELQNSGMEISTGSFSNKINNRSPFNQIWLTSYRWSRLFVQLVLHGFYIHQKGL